MAAFNWLQLLYRNQEGSESSARTESLAAPKRSAAPESQAANEEFQPWLSNTTEQQPRFPKEATSTEPNSSTTDFALPYKDRTGRPEPILVTPAAGAQEPTSTALTAALTNPIWNPATPTANQWIAWLDGLGQLSVGSSRVVNVGLYTGPTTTHARVRVSPLSSQYLANCEEIFYEMNSFLDIKFDARPITSISSTNSTYPLRVFSGKISGYAYAYGPGSGSLNSDMFFNINYDKAGLDTNFFRNGYGSHGWQTTWHETGHAIGLNHTFESGTPIQFDNWNYSSMTYTFDGGELKSWGVGDLAYLQYLYGVNSLYNSGNDIYKFDDIDSFDNYYSDGGSGAPTYSSFTNAVLYDAGGSDTCDFSGLSKGIRYDFDDITGTSSVCYLDEFLKQAYTINKTTQYMTGSQTAVAYGTIIESVIGTNLSDQFLTASSRSEYVDGGSGDDYVYLPGRIDQYQASLVGDTTTITAAGTSSIEGVFKGIEYFVFDSPSVYRVANNMFTLA